MKKSSLGNAEETNLDWHRYRVIGDCLWPPPMRDTALSPPRVHQSGPSMHALIIEPQAFTACDIEDALRDIGYTSFDFAMTTEDAIAAAAEHRPDLITAAVQLTPGCGISAVEAICSEQPVPVVFITHAEKVVRQRDPEVPVVKKQPFRVRDLSEAVAVARALLHKVRTGFSARCATDD